VIPRRQFMTLLGGAAAAWPVAARGQTVRRIGMLVSGAETDPEMQERVAAIRQGLSRFGWSEGHNIQIDSRYASANAQRAAAMAKELLSLQPELLLGMGTMTVTALQRESAAVPIVFIGVPDPIGAGFVASLARPGGYLTGTLTAALASRGLLPVLALEVS
jgi:putative ABC transport system substrate-binding protein